MTAESPKDKIYKWFVKPTEKLDGDGGFIPLMLGLCLAERLIMSKTHKDSKIRKEKPFEEYGEDLFKIPKAIFEPFWDMYRNGLMHFGQPFSGRFSKKNDIYWDWDISSKYEGRPEVIEIEPKKKLIKINPWKWLQIVASAYDSYPDLIDHLSCVKLGEIGNVPSFSPHPLSNTSPTPPLPKLLIDDSGTGSCPYPPKKT